MLEITSTEFRSQPGHFLDVSMEEAVLIKKPSKRSTVMLSEQEYAYLQSLEDAFLGIQAQQAISRNQFVDHVQAMEILNNRLK